MQRQKTRNIKVRAKMDKRTTFNYDYKEVPWLNMTGLWLRNVGFDIGDVLEVTVLGNAIMITKK